MTISTKMYGLIATIFISIGVLVFSIASREVVAFLPELLGLSANELEQKLGARYLGYVFSDLFVRFLFAVLGIMVSIFIWVFLAARVFGVKEDVAEKSIFRAFYEKQTKKSPKDFWFLKWCFLCAYGESSKS